MKTEYTRTQDSGAATGTGRRPPKLTGLGGRREIAVDGWRAWDILGALREMFPARGGALESFPGLERGENNLGAAGQLRDLARPLPKPTWKT